MPVASEGGDAGATLVATDSEHSALRLLVRPGQSGARTLDRRMMRRLAGLKIPNLLHDREKVEELSGALAHLCRLIRRDRQPECPLNGILVLLPLGGTDTKDDAQLTADIVQRDMTNIRRVTQLRAPAYAVLCDLEEIPGFRDFAIKQRGRAGRVGQRFPLKSPDQEGAEVLESLKKAVQVYCQRGLRDLVYPLFDVRSDDTAGNDGYNRNLYLLLDEMRERKDHLARILANGLEKLTDGPLLFGGCYLAATGTDEKEQAFVKGVFARLAESQSYVSWTPEALEQDQNARRTATIGYLVIAVLIVLVGIWAFFVFTGRH
jgi:hypothetical protein